MNKTDLIFDNLNNATNSINFVYNSICITPKEYENINKEKALAEVLELSKTLSAIYKTLIVMKYPESVIKE